MNKFKFPFLLTYVNKIIRLLLFLLLLITLINFINIKKNRGIHYLLNLIMLTELKRVQVLILGEYKLDI